MDNKIKYTKIILHYYVWFLYYKYDVIIHMGIKLKLFFIDMIIILNPII